jgi:hypothetical protein
MIGPALLATVLRFGAFEREVALAAAEAGIRAPLVVLVQEGPYLAWIEQCVYACEPTLVVRLDALWQTKHSLGDIARHEVRHVRRGDHGGTP